MKISPAFVFYNNVFVSLALFPGPVIKDASKKAETVQDRLAFISRVETRYRVIKTTSTITDCRDKKDNILLELAVDVSASCLITGDLDLLVLHPYRGIPILRAGDFLQGFSG